MHRLYISRTHVPYDLGSALDVYVCYDPACLIRSQYADGTITYAVVTCNLNLESAPSNTHLT